MMMMMIVNLYSTFSKKTALLCYCICCPWLYDQFVSHGHTIRRTSRFRASWLTDPVIEQTMLKALKSHLFNSWLWH